LWAKKKIIYYAQEGNAHPGYRNGDPVSVFHPLIYVKLFTEEWDVESNYVEGTLDVQNRSYIPKNSAYHTCERCAIQSVFGDQHGI
jgi:hypothetical protein